MTSDQGLEWLISVDDHVIEPPSVWTDRLPKRYVERGPHFVSASDGPTCVYEDQGVPIRGAVTNGAIPELGKREMPWRMLDFDRIHPSCYDPVERSKAMDEDHVLASLVFANMPGFCGNLFTRAKDKDLALQVGEWMQRMARTMDTIPGDRENEPTVAFDDGDDDTNEVSGKAFLALAQRSREQWNVPAVREQFRDHVLGCFIEDPHGIKNIEEIGIDNVMIETDFPHSSTRFPHSAQLANEVLAGLSAEDSYTILQGNARLVFHFEPAEVAATAVPAR